MRRYVIPYIEQQRAVTADMRVLEIGCGEAGNLKPFLDLGCDCIGIDIDQPRIEVAKMHFADHPHADRMRLICSDIYDVNPQFIGGGGKYHHSTRCNRTYTPSGAIYA